MQLIGKSALPPPPPHVLETCATIREVLKIKGAKRLRIAGPTRAPYSSAPPFSNITLFNIATNMEGNPYFHPAV